MAFEIILATSRNVTFRPITPPLRPIKIRSVISRARIPSLTHSTLLGGISLIQTHSAQQTIDHPHLRPPSMLVQQYRYTRIFTLVMYPSDHRPVYGTSRLTYFLIVFSLSGRKMRR